MDDQKDHNQQHNHHNKSKKKKRDISSTTSLGKRRTFDKRQPGRKQSPGSPAVGHEEISPEVRERASQQAGTSHHQTSKAYHYPASGSGSPSTRASTMSEPRTSEYGSQATLMRVPVRKPDEKPIKVTVIGASGGIGQPLGLLLMLHSEYIQHLALYDLTHIRGIGADLSHVDRQCKLTTHLGPDELPEAVKDANVIIILAGIAQKPGMSRDDLFGTNAKIIYDIAKVCAQNAPEAHLAIVSNPVNSLVPIVNQVYQRILQGGPNKHVNDQHESPKQGSVGKGQQPAQQQGQANQQQQQQPEAARHNSKEQQHHQEELPAWCRRIFGVTTLDVVRASTLVAKSPFFTAPDAPIFKDPSKVTLPVVGGHAGKTILPLLSRANPKIDKKRLIDDMKLTTKVIESVQEAGIDVLNAKKGLGSATLAMAYSACRFTISLLRAQLGETNIVECAYVRHPSPVFDNLDYFAMPLQLGKHGWIKALNPLTKALPFEQHMAEEAAKLLRASVARGEDFAKEQLSIDKL